MSVDPRSVSKPALRAQYKEIRQQLEPYRVATAEKRLLDVIQHTPQVMSASLILMYASKDNEVPTTELIELFWKTGIRVALPRVMPDHRLDFCEITSFDNLVESRMHILEPPKDAPVLTRDDLIGSLCFVPGLAFDGEGHRLGYGGGFYDRFLATYPGYKIGLARAGSISPTPLPTESTDITMDFLVSERGWWNCNPYCS